MARNDGGQAFPRPKFWDGDGNPDNDCEQGGMSLRDYFAAKALHGVLQNLADMNAESRADLPRFARDCYKMADAMLAERAK